jgi:hypothetical protein
MNLMTYLEIEDGFYYLIDNLPSSITHLSIKGSFNQPIDNLPNSITHLSLRGHFNQPIDNLPNSITHLSLRGHFNQPIDNLPNSITRLSIDGVFNQSIDNLPSSIKYLSILNVKYNKKIYKFPKSLKVLETNKRKITTEYDISYYNIKKIIYSYNRSMNVLKIPDYVTHLYLKIYINKKMTFINKPNNLKKILLRHKHNIQHIPEEYVEYCELYINRFTWFERINYIFLVNEQKKNKTSIEISDDEK